MGIKLIAVDMDGTFLNDEKKYHRERFAAQYQQMKSQGIRFVVASGNQYYQLRSFFPTIADEISFVADNGAWVVSEGEDLFNGELTPEACRTVINHLLTQPQLEIIVSGKQRAYTLNRYEERFKQLAARYYHQLAFVDDFTSLDDCIFKFALNLPDSDLEKTMDALRDKLDGIVVPVTSGHGSIDLIIPGLHKAHGLSILQKRWNIRDEEVVTFGDGGNDIEMLSQAGFGFAMANAPDKIKKIAPYQTGHCNDQGVLDVIDAVLNKQAPFYQ